MLNEIRSPNDGRGGEKILAEAWPGDRHALAILTRAATAPATTTTAGWAAELAVTTTANAFLGSLSPSAASRLFAAGLVLPLDGVAALRVPYQAATPSLAPSLVAEGAPIPVRQAALTTVTLGPTRKLATIVGMTNEIGSYSTPVAEQVIRQILVESAARALDLAVFSTGAGGLLNGVSGITATAGGGVAALIGDLKALIGALTTAGATRVMLFMASALMASVAIYAPGGFGPAIEIVPANLGTTVVAIDPSGVVSGAAGQPRIDVGRETLLHFEDTSPLQFSTGAPGSAVLATPSRNLYQTDSMALRLLVDCAWVARPGYVQFVSNVTW